MKEKSVISYDYMHLRWVFVCACGMFLSLMFLRCTPRQLRFASESVKSSASLSIMPALDHIREALGDYQKSQDNEMDRYRQILEQEYRFHPPVTILLIVPPSRRYGIWGYLDYREDRDSLTAMLYNRFVDKAVATDYVKEVKQASSIFESAALDNLLELSARYRADECLILSYDIVITQPLFCLGFWPASYLMSDFTAEAVLIDTRTGFILMSKKYSCSERIDLTPGMAANKELEVMKQIVPRMIDSLVVNLVQFYEEESLLEK